MSVSDLTNTTWKLGRELNCSIGQFELGDEYSHTFNINFTSNGNTYNSLRLHRHWYEEEMSDDVYDDETGDVIDTNTWTEEHEDNEIYYGNSSYYNGADDWDGDDADGNGGYESPYQTITITGGTDATDSDLITWLEANATQQSNSSPSPSQSPSASVEMWFGASKIENIYLMQNNTLTEVVDTSLDLPKPLQECTWTEIKQICKDGNAKKYWQVGDTKTITCTDGYTYTIRIVDMQEGRYKYVSDNSPTHCVFELQQVYSTTQYLASSGASEVGLYKNTPMHTTYLPNILKTFNDIKNVLENVYITCLTSINDDTFESVSTKVFLPSAVEYMDYTLSTHSSFNERMNLERISPYDNTQYDVFDYYKTHSAEKKKITDGTTANTYWTRLYQTGTYWHVIATPLDQSGTTISNQYPALRNGNPSKSWVIFCFAL